MIFGGVVLLSGTVLLVRSALLISEAFGLKEFYVELTITAVGCIVPEAAVSIFAALQGEQEISIGNVIGDNIITITLVFGLVAIIVPLGIPLMLRFWKSSQPCRSWFLSRFFCFL
ncbi:MAG: hypothetical protein QXE76_05930 [Candidatus Bathyarchaeia archaeon]